MRVEANRCDLVFVALEGVEELGVLSCFDHYFKLLVVFFIFREMTNNQRDIKMSAHVIGSNG